MLCRIDLRLSFHAGGDIIIYPVPSARLFLFFACDRMTVIQTGSIAMTAFLMVVMSRPSYP